MNAMSLKEVLNKGIYMQAFPYNYRFSHPSSVYVDCEDYLALVGRVLASDVEVGGIKFMNLVPS